MDQSTELGSPPKINRRSFLKKLFGVGAAAGLTAVFGQEMKAQSVPNNATPLPIQPESPIVNTEIDKVQTINVYHDLTPGIGIGVAWVGTGSTWNTIVENIIKATTDINVQPYVYVPRYQEGSFDKFIAANDIKENSYMKILCDPEYEESNDAVEMGSGKNNVVKKNGFPSSWIRDWGSLIASDGNDKINLDIRKNAMPDPLKGTNVQIQNKDIGLKFDGGAFFYLKNKEGLPVVLASENEFVNNNSYYIKHEKGKDIDIKEEVTKRVREAFGSNTEVIYLPKLVDNGVDHIDTFVMPLGEDIIVVGESLEGDKNYEMLNEVSTLLATKGFNVHRVPIRTVEENNTVTYTNVLPHLTEDGQKYVFMPTYEGFQTENDIAKTIYSNLGFTVVPVDATSTMDKGGSIHCATNASITAPFIKTL